MSCFNIMWIPRCPFFSKSKNRMLSIKRNTLTTIFRSVNKALNNTLVVHGYFTCGINGLLQIFLTADAGYTPAAPHICGFNDHRISRHFMKRERFFIRNSPKPRYIQSGITKCAAHFVFISGNQIRPLAVPNKSELPCNIVNCINRIIRRN